MNWVAFHFDSNRFFDTVNNYDDWKRLRIAYPKKSDDELLAAKESTRGGPRPPDGSGGHRMFGFGHLFDGGPLRAFFEEHGMSLPKE